jgi:hypothetical protein
MSNVPDDWGCYYTSCGLCGERYHMSEGGCGCTGDLECQCGSGCWEGNSADSLVCADCGTGPHEDLSTKRTVHVARKDHADGKVLKGQRYMKFMNIGFYPNGRMTRSFTKKLMEA